LNLVFKALHFIVAGRTLRQRKGKKNLKAYNAAILAHQQCFADMMTLKCKSPSMTPAGPDFMEQNGTHSCGSLALPDSETTSEWFDGSLTIGATMMESQHGARRISESVRLEFFF
jgi:hypothetical protein